MAQAYRRTLPLIAAGAALLAALTSAAAPAAGPDAAAIIDQLAARCRPWLDQPGPELLSLSYIYRLGNDQRKVELARGTARGPRSLWQGTTLFTGLHFLFAAPENYTAVAERIEGDGEHAEPFVRITARPKASDQPFYLTVGNGIDRSWRGFFGHASSTMRLDLDPDTLLPLREIHDQSSYEFRDWQKVGADAWIPRLIVVRRGDTLYRMHFAWHGGAAWLLTRAEMVADGRTVEVARTSDVQVNDQRVSADLAEREQRQAEARDIIRQMLARNAAWLQPEMPFDSIAYTFHASREDVREECVVRRDGLTAFEVVHDGQGKMAGRVGERRIVSPDGRMANAKRSDARASLREVAADRDEPNEARQLRRYALIGSQFDLPLFELPRVVDGATVEVEDGQWNGTPCYVATISVPGRSAWLGCGTMLAFSSWSYVHHLRPAYEVLYIDRQRLVPLHETFISDWDNRRFEIDYLDYAPVGQGDGRPGAPQRIQLEAKDYFTCHYEFQLVAGRHWLLKSVESWFKPEDKSRGVIENVRVDEPSPLADDAQRQVDAYKALFEPQAGRSAAAQQTVAVAAHPFVLGRPLQMGAAELVFTLDDQEKLVARCTARPADVQPGQTVRLLLLDDADRIVQAAQATFAEAENRLVATASFGNSLALGRTRRFVVAGLTDAAPTDADQRRLQAFRPVVDGPPTPGAPVTDRSGKTRLIDVALNRDDRGQLSVAVHFASRDAMNEFVLDVSVGVFDASGQLIAAGAKSGGLRVESQIVEETWNIPLPKLLAADQIDSVAVGLTRGATTSAPMGTLWGTFLTRQSPFSIVTMLAAEEPGCWTVGLRRLEEQIDDALEAGLLDGADDWQEQVASSQTPADLLLPHRDRLLDLADRAADASALAATLRLLGHAGAEDAAERAVELLQHDNPGVRDAAAICLGLLRRDEALRGIDAILARPASSGDHRAARANHRNARQALIALATIRSDASVAMVRKWLLAYVDGIGMVDNHRSPVGNTRGYSEQLTQLLSVLPDPRYVDALIEALNRIEGRADLKRRYEDAELLAALVAQGEHAHQEIASRVRRGDAAALYAIDHAKNDGRYVSAIRDMLSIDADAQAWHSAVDYLWNAGTTDAVDILRQAYDRGLPHTGDNRRVRLRMAEALAYRDDNRGLTDALGVLVELQLQRPAEAPSGRELPKNQARERERLHNAALAVFERAETSAVAATLLSHAESDDPPTRLALLAIMEEKASLPDPMRPHVERWVDDASSALVAERAARLLIKHR